MKPRGIIRLGGKSFGVLDTIESNDEGCFSLTIFGFVKFNGASDSSGVGDLDAGGDLLPTLADI